VATFAKILGNTNIFSLQNIKINIGYNYVIKNNTVITKGEIF